MLQTVPAVLDLPLTLDWLHVLHAGLIGDSQAESFVAPWARSGPWAVFDDPGVGHLADLSSGRVLAFQDFSRCTFLAP